MKQRAGLHRILWELRTAKTGIYSQIHLRTVRETAVRNFQDNLRLTN